MKRLFQSPLDYRVFAGVSGGFIVDVDVVDDGEIGA